MRKRNKGEDHPNNRTNRRKGPDKQENNYNRNNKSHRGNYGGDGPSEDDSQHNQRPYQKRRRGRGGRGRGRGGYNNRRRNYNDDYDGDSGYVSKNGGNRGRGGRGGRGNNRGGRGNNRGGRGNNRGGRGGYNQGYYKRRNGDNEEGKIVTTGVGGYKKRRNRKRGAGGNNYQRNQEVMQHEHEREEEFRGERPKFEWPQCLICLVKVNPRQTIWNCVQCKKSVHLKCIKDWIYKSNEVEKNQRRRQKNNQIFNWQCPHCMFQYTQMIPKYYCYCGKVKNPPGDPYLEPHSCGRKCGRYAHDNCKHPCQKLCHSDKCQPCEVPLPKEKCYCGKELISRKCQDFKELVCGNACEKELNCRKHYCKKNCHSGDCGSCEEKVVLDCFCGKVEDKEFNCGGAEDKKGGFECGLICDKVMDCGLHKCDIKCHSGECKKCPMVPVKRETCYCGGSKVIDILGKERENCLIEIPSCHKPCGKILDCGHKCLLKCHSGPCDCGEKVRVKCRCGKGKFEAKCIDRNNQVLCDRVCNKKKSCNKCRCERVCCEVKRGKDPARLHHCFEQCGNMLPCGKHPCPKKCHAGKCGDCTIMINSTVSCACGAKKVGPPVRCGQGTPYCEKTCNKILKCGHPCYYRCHFGECKPCQEIIDKPCNCGAMIRKGAICSQDYKCTKPCDKVLACGHKCNQICHKGTCEQLVHDKRQALKERGVEVSELGCLQQCLKPRKACGHPCQETCHPGSECPLDACPIKIKISCECGNRHSFVNCGATDQKIKKSLNCDDRCKNIRRFKSLYSKGTRKAYYPPGLVKFARNHLSFLKKQEEVIHEFVISNERSMKFSVSKKSPKKLWGMLSLLARHYNLDVFYIKSSSRFLVTACKLEESLIPPMRLSEYYDKIEKQEIKVDDLPFEATFKFFNLTMYDKLKDLDTCLGDLKQHCYTEKSGMTIYLNLWSKEYVPGVSKRLEKAMNNFSNFAVEIKEEPENSDDDVDGNNDEGKEIVVTKVESDEEETEEKEELEEAQEEKEEIEEAQEEKEEMRENAPEEEEVEGQGPEEAHGCPSHDHHHDNKVEEETKEEEIKEVEEMSDDGNDEWDGAPRQFGHQSIQKGIIKPNAHGGLSDFESEGEEEEEYRPQVSDIAMLNID